MPHSQIRIAGQKVRDSGAGLEMTYKTLQNYCLMLKQPWLTLVILKRHNDQAHLQAIQALSRKEERLRANAMQSFC
jgi:hypothetical protein